MRLTICALAVLVGLAPRAAAAETEPTPEIRYGEPTKAPETLQHGEAVPPQDSGFRYADPRPSSETDLSFGSTTRPAPTDAVLSRSKDRELEVRQTQAKRRSRFSLTVKMGPYVPDFDRPYQDAVGDRDAIGAYGKVHGRQDEVTGEAIDTPRPGLLTMIGFEWNVFHFGGPLSVSVGVGFFRQSAGALIGDAELASRQRKADLLEAYDPDADTKELRRVRADADKTAFHVVPITLSAGYRFSLLAEKTPVPLLPYVRGGFSYGVWWSLDGSRRLERTADGEKAHGGSMGGHLDLGLMLDLAFLTQGGATKGPSTALFGEWRFSKMDGLGEEARVSVGDHNWVAGVQIGF